VTAERPFDEAIGEYLDWDSRFFGVRIGRAVPRRLSAETAARLLRWCASQQIDCVYMLADPGDIQTVRLVEERGFRCVDIRVTLNRSAADPGRGGAKFDGTVRNALQSDVTALRAMARTGFRLSRFYFDPTFPRASVDALYETWIEKSCNGYADAVLVAASGGQVAGYVTCHRDGAAKGRLGLLGVRDDWQGRGLGHVLVNSALAWFRESGASEVYVVTQGRNRAALRLYQGCGFVIDAVELWYHRWFTTKGDDGNETHSV